MDQSETWIEPVSAGTTLFCGQNFDLFTRFERIVQRDEFIINLGAPASITHRGMDMICKIDWCGSCWQINDVSMWCKDIYAIFEDISLHTIYEFLGVIHILAPIHHLPQPIHSLIIPVSLTALL